MSSMKSQIEMKSLFPSIHTPTNTDPREEGSTCHDLEGALGGIVGLMGVALVGVVLGWILTCWKKTKK